MLPSTSRASLTSVKGDGWKATAPELLRGQRSPTNPSYTKYLCVKSLTQCPDQLQFPPEDHHKLYFRSTGMIYSGLSYLHGRNKTCQEVAIPGRNVFIYYVLSTILHLPFAHRLTARASGGFPAVLIATPSKLSFSPVCDNDTTTSLHSIQPYRRC